MRLQLSFLGDYKALFNLCTQSSPAALTALGFSCCTDTTSTCRLFIPPVLFHLTSHQVHYPRCHFQLALEWKVKSRPCKGEVILFLFRWFCLPHGVTLANPFIQPDKNLPIFHERPLCECHTEFAQWNGEDQPEKCRAKGLELGGEPV